MGNSSRIVAVPRLSSTTTRNRNGSYHNSKTPYVISSSSERKEKNSTLSRKQNENKKELPKYTAQRTRASNLRCQAEGGFLVREWPETVESHSLRIFKTVVSRLLILALLLTSGDVSPNPGPASGRFAHSVIRSTTHSRPTWTTYKATHPTRQRSFVPQWRHFDSSPHHPRATLSNVVPQTNRRMVSFKSTTECRTFNRIDPSAELSTPSSHPVSNRMNNTRVQPEWTHYRDEETTAEPLNTTIHTPIWTYYGTGRPVEHSIVPFERVIPPVPGSTRPASPASIPRSVHNLLRPNSSDPPVWNNFGNPSNAATNFGRSSATARNGPPATPNPRRRHRSRSFRNRRWRTGNSGLREAENLIIIQTNSDGLTKPSKLAELESKHADVVAIQETKWNAGKTYKLSDYSCVSQSRGTARQDGPVKGGGVAIFVRNGLKFHRLTHSPIHASDTTTEWCAVSVETNKGDVHIYNLYCPPICERSRNDDRRDNFNPDALPVGNRTLISITASGMTT